MKREANPKVFIRWYNKKQKRRVKTRKANLYSSLWDKGKKTTGQAGRKENKQTAVVWGLPISWLQGHDVREFKERERERERGMWISANLWDWLKTQDGHRNKGKIYIYIS